MRFFIFYFLPFMLGMELNCRARLLIYHLIYVPLDFMFGPQSSESHSDKASKYVLASWHGKAFVLLQKKCLGSERVRLLPVTQP